MIDERELEAAERLKFWKFFGLLVSLPVACGALWLLWIVIRLIHWELVVR